MKKKSAQLFLLRILFVVNRTIISCCPLIKCQIIFWQLSLTMNYITIKKISFQIFTWYDMLHYL